MRTAQEVVAQKTAIFAQLKDAENAKSQLTDIFAAFKRVRKWDSTSQELGAKIETISAEISARGKESEKNANLSIVC